MNPLKYLLYPPVGDIQTAYPLIIFLHGSGERGGDLELVKKWGLPHYTETGEVALPTYIVVPQCPTERTWSEAKTLDTLDAMLDDLLTNYPIDKERVYLTGFSMGGFGTWAWALRRPQRFAAIMPVGGSGFAEVDLSALKDKPIWMIHGAVDSMVSVAGADETAAALAKLGSNFGYTRYPDAEHGETSNRAFADMAHYRWLLAQTLDPEAES